MRLPLGSLTPNPGIKKAQGDPRRRAETGHFRALGGLAHRGGVFQLRSMPQVEDRGGCPPQVLITSWKCGAPCRTAGKPPAKPPENRWKTAGDHGQNRWKTAGRPLAKPRSNHRQTAGKPPENYRKTAGKPLAKLSENRWKTVGKTAGRPLAKPLENRRKTAVELAEKTVGKPPGKPPEKPRFWVTFASLNKGLEWSGRASPTSFFGPWGGVAIGGSFPGSTHVLSHPMGLAERGFAGF